MTTTLAPPAPTPVRTSLQTLLADRRHRAFLLAMCSLVAVASVRVATGANDLTSSGTFSAALRLTVPILLAGIGGLYAERCGVINIGLEGMMILGTWFAAWAGWQWGPWWGVVFGLIGGALGGLLHAVATVTFGIDHIVSGVAINILAPGITRFLSSEIFVGQPGASASISPGIKGTVGRISLPFLSGGPIGNWHSPDPFGRIARWHWFLVSDIAGALKALTSGLSWLTVAALALIPFTAVVLWRTPFGLRLRSVGEQPSAADSLGVPVYRMKYIGVLISGALAGLGGAVLVLDAGAQRYQEGQTAGRGFIGLAAMIFGNWRPVGVALGSGLFGLADALQLRSDASIRALVWLLAVAAIAALIWGVMQKRVVRSLWLLALIGMLLAYNIITKRVANQFVYMTPYLTTLMVLAFASQHLRPPAADGVRWRKGDQL